MIEPKLGIVIPTYNRKDLIKIAINSVLKQKYNKFEICIIDDGSEIPVKNFIKEDKNIKIITFEKNQGVNAARNAGVEYFLKRDVDFITFIDDDDEFCENAFREFVKDCNVHRNQNWFVYKVKEKNGKQITKLYDTGEIDYLWYFYRIKINRDAHHFVKKDYLKDVKFTCEFKNGQEWYFWFHLGRKTKMFVINKYMSKKEYLPGGLSDKKTKKEKRQAYYFKQYVMKKFGLSHLKWSLIKKIYYPYNKLKECLK
jgi:glycosyltransferase involved in cell wall biosynthesis